MKPYSKPLEERQQDDDQHTELRRLRAELKRVTEAGRRILGCLIRNLHVLKTISDYWI